MKISNIILTLFLILIDTFYLHAKEKKEMIHNIATLGYEATEDGKSWKDKKTEYTISKCSDNYNVSKQFGINSQKKEPACAKTDDYEGACWVTNLGFTGGAYKAEICYQSPSGYAQCKVLANGKSSGKFSLKMKSLSYTDPYYMGSFSNEDECPDYKYNINSLGYVYIKEATDTQYTNAIDFDVKFCRPLSEKYNPNNCSSPQLCPCTDEECRKNNFIPPKNSNTWKQASQKAKNCYLCLQKYRAVNFYCNKIYRCLNKNTKSYAYELAKSDYRQYVDELYGEGSYLCGYYDGKLCGCGKSRLSAGPRHFLRIAKKTDSCETKEDFISNPQCNLFGDGVYARQFYNDHEDHNDADCPYEINPEFGYKKRGTFFSPKITIVSGKNERLIGYDSSLLIDSESYYYNSPIGESESYSSNNFYGFPTAKKILFSNFYPVIFTIGSLNPVKDEEGNCATKPSGDINYIMLRMEYNFSTNESALVAYKVRFLNTAPSQLEDNKLLLSDGSISKFIVEDERFINAIKKAKNTDVLKNKMGRLEFKYDYDPNTNFSHTEMPEKGKYLYFENIGKVVRPPLKYTYDEGSIYINTPIVLEEDLTIDPTLPDTKEKRLKISIVPSNLGAFTGDEFLSDKNLAPIVKKISIAGYDKDAFNLIDDVITNKSSADITSEAILYMKRFSVGYNNSCIFLKTMIGPGLDEYLLNNPPTEISACSGLTPIEKKMACLISFMSLYECNGYVNCLDKETSISSCQNENRMPKIKLLGTDADLPEYKKNIDFRSYTQVCINEGFEFADRLSDYSNTKLFGDFGYAPYDYTIRWKKNGSGIASSTPGRPLSIRYNDVVKSPAEFQDKPKDIVTMDIDYFSSPKTKRTTNMLNRMMGVNMIDISNGMPSEQTVYSQYASDCTYNQKLCENRYEVQHRLINETLGTLCVTAGDFNQQEWKDLKPRDLGIDYHVYIPLRCQYVHFEGTGAGGGGFTTEDCSNCLVKFHVIESSWYLAPWPMPGFPSGAYLRTPKFDATGSQGGKISTTINLNSLPVFDGYLYLSIGSRTFFSRANIEGEKDEAPEKCYIGVTPYGEPDYNTKDWFVRGASHGFWHLPLNAIIYLSGNKPYYNGQDVTKYYDYRKGSTEIAFNTHGSAITQFDEKAYLTEMHSLEEQKLETYLDGFTELFQKDKNNRLLEFYFVSLMHLSYRLQIIDNAIFEGQKIALQEVKEKYEHDLEVQKDLKNQKETEKNDYQDKLNKSGTCEITETQICFTQPNGTKTCTQKSDANASTKEDECNTLINDRKSWQDSIDLINTELIPIEDEITRLQNIIDNNRYPENEIKEYDLSLSTSFEDISSKITAINDNIETEQTSWIGGDNATEQRSIAKEEKMIENIRKYYGGTDVDRLNEIINEYETAISYVNNIKQDYCSNTIVKLNLTNKNISSLITVKNNYEAQFADIISRMIGVEGLTAQRDAVNTLFNKCKTHVNELIDISTSKPVTYVDEIEFIHGNNYGLLKTLMCFAFDSQTGDCDEANSINSHNKIEKSEDSSENLCTKTSIDVKYDSAKTAFSISDTSFETNKVCTRTDIEDNIDQYKCTKGEEHCVCVTDTMCYRDDVEIETQETTCTEGSDNCECRDVDSRKAIRYTDSIVKASEDAIKNKFSEIQSEIHIIKGIELQISEVDDTPVADDVEYQYLATAKRGSSPIDARIFRKRIGQGNVPYFNNDSQHSGEVTVLWRSMTMPHHYCSGFLGNDDSCLYDIAANHNHIQLEQKEWIDSMRTRVLNDGIGFSNEEYTRDTQKISQSLLRSSEISTELDSRAMLSAYDKKEGMSGNGPGSTYDHNAVKGTWNKFESAIGAGGSFHHLQGSGGGGEGYATISFSAINIKQFEYNGESYPELNDDGSKKITTEKNFPDQQCIIKCPPINTVIKNFQFYFPEIKTTAPIDILCEYAGEPEHDMEITVGSSVIPKKCYILTESVSGVGDVKGKIIMSSNGICPIAKCPNGTWGTDARPGQPVTTSQYDRNTGICKPKDNYGGESKTSKYFMMMFDKNVYSGFAYTGSRNTPLMSSVPQYKDEKWIMNTYEIAKCSTTKIGAYFVDTYDQLATLSMECGNGGFWNYNRGSTPDPLYETIEYSTKCIKNSDTYTNCAVSNSYDKDRNAVYNEKSNNAFLNKIEYLVQDVSYTLGKQNGNEFSKSTDGYKTTGIRSMATSGRTVFKDMVKCPMIDSNRYDFDADYSGNAIWDFADENSVVRALRCKENSIQIGSLPQRVCKVNGLWGPVINPTGSGCGKVCDTEVDGSGTKWIVTDDDIQKLGPEETTVIVNGACSSNYLNSQNYKIGSSGSATRSCNLMTGNWSEITQGSDCNDTLVCIPDNYKKENVAVATPYARTIIFSKSNEYDSLINKINSTSDGINKYTKYQDNLYLAFNPERKHSDIFDSDYYEVNNNYVNVNIEEKNFDADGNAYITDKNRFRLVEKMANNDYYVISVANAIYPNAFDYMLAQGDETRNEFLNVQNWVSTLKNSQMNFTGQWAWKANLSSIRSKLIYESTSEQTQEIYKNSQLFVLIPKMTDNNKNLQHIALFSPYLAKQMGAGTDIVPDEEANIKFRYMFEIKNEYKVSNRPYAMTVYNGMSSARLYRFEWEKNDNKDWSEIDQNTHIIGRDCNGKYFGYIKHNTTKHVMYTEKPTTSNDVFASLYCYDGRIFGFHAFRADFIQDEGLTDENTKSILLSNDSYHTTGAQDVYNRMKEYFDSLHLNNDYFSDAFDNYRAAAKNAYIFSIMARYWQAHIFPTDDEQKNFIENYQPNNDINYNNVNNQKVKDIMEQYAKGKSGKYYRIAPRKVDWISGTSPVEKLNDLNDISETLNTDPYCLSTECLSGIQLSNDINSFVNEQIDDCPS